MDFRLYSLLCMVASTYCLRPPAEFRAKLSKCPQISGPSVVDHLDINNSGVERLVVHFYKPRNSHQIVSFIPSKEYQNCIKDIVEVGGETIYDNNGISIEGLFDSQQGTIRNRIEPTETIPETIKFPDHFDVNKRPDWHIPVEHPDVHDNPWQYFPLSQDHPHKDNPIEIPVIGYQDEEKDQGSDISIIEPIPLDANMRPIVSDYEETPLRPHADLMYPNQENTIIGPNHHDILRPIAKEEFEAPIIRPVEKHIIRPNHEDKLRPIIRDEIDVSPVRPLDNLITGPNYHDILRPISTKEIDASPIRPLESPISGLNDLDKLRPIIIDKINAPPIRPLENSIIEPNHHDISRPIVEDEINASPLKTLEYYIIGPDHQDTLRPIIRDDINPSLLRAIDNHIIGPNHHDILRPIIRDEINPSSLRPLENHIIGPNHHDTLRPIIRDELNPTPLRPIDSHIIGPNHHDTLRPIIRDEIDPSPLSPLNNHIIGPNHYDTLRPIIRDEINPSPLSPLNNHIIGPNHYDTLRPIIRDEINPSPLSPLNNHIIGPNHHDTLRPIIRDEIKPTPLRPLDNHIIGPNTHDSLRPIIRDEINPSPLRPIENYIIGPNHHDDTLRPIIMDEINSSPLRPLENHIIGPNYHDILRPINREESGMPVIRPIEKHNIGPNHDDKLRPIIRDEINPTTRPNHHYVIRPINREESLTIGPNHDIITEEEIHASPLRPIENVITGPNNHDKLRPIIWKDQQKPENSKAPVIRPLNYLDIKSNHHDPKLLPIVKEEIEGSIIRPHDHLPSSRENIQGTVDKMKHKLNSEELAPEVINGGLDINDIPKENHGHNIIEHGDSNESLDSHNGDSHETNTLTHTNSLNFPSKEAEETPDRVNLIYKWHKVKVPRIDSSGKNYGWYWKSVKSPVRSKSVKWSYWQSRGQKHRLTHWKHKSTTSSKIYHHSSTIPDFDGWVKKQIKNMKNKGNKMPSSDHDINNVKVAIEKALETNGIKVKSSGVLTDANGHILRLDNVQLRPIYIGRSLFNPMIHQNSADSTKYRIPADTPFLEGLLVSLIKPAKTLGIVPLGITALPHVNSKDITKKLLDSGRELHPISIQNGLHKLLNGNMPDIGKILPKHRSKVTVKEEDKSLSEEEPEFRIIGGSFAMGSGTPLANRGRSGKD